MHDIDMRMFARNAGVNVTFPADSIVFSRGDQGSCMYVIQSGVIEMLIGDKVVEVCGPNEAIGFMSMSRASGRRHGQTNQPGGQKGQISRKRPVDPKGRPDIVRPLRGPLFYHMGLVGPCGGTGRRARLKIEFRKECWFDSGQGHHPASPSEALA